MARYVLAYRLEAVETAEGLVYEGDVDIKALGRDGDLREIEPALVEMAFRDLKQYRELGWPDVPLAQEADAK